MKRILCGMFLALALAGCGDGQSRHTGSLAWDAGVGVLEVTGTGTFDLELNNNGPAILRLSRSGNAPTAFAPGDSIRVRGKGPELFRFEWNGEKRARVDYVSKAERGTHVDARIE